MTKCRQNRIRSGLAQSAEGAFANVVAKLVEEIEMSRRTPTGGDLVQNTQALIKSDTTGNAFSAGFRMRELYEIASHVDHAVVFIHHHHPARSHDGSQCSERFVVN